MGAVFMAGVDTMAGAVTMVDAGSAGTPTWAVVSVAAVSAVADSTAAGLAVEVSMVEAALVVVVDDGKTR